MADIPWIVIGMSVVLSAGIHQLAEAREKRDIVNVPRQFAGCILSNKGRYEETARVAQKRMISIYPTICPATTPSPQQLADLTRNSGGEISADSATILVPLTKSSCFFNRLARLNQRAQRGTSIAVDITDCGR